MTFRMIAFAAALGLGAAAVHAAPPAPQAVTPVDSRGHVYDCTKLGNKNKKACENVTPGGVAAPAGANLAARPATAAKPATPAAAKSATPAKPLNYDCTKAGNANKQACKTVVVPPATASAAKPAAAVLPPAAHAATGTPAGSAMTPARPAASPTPAVRAAPAAKPANPNEVAATLKNGKVVHYDCSKAGNKDKKACAAK